MVAVYTVCVVAVYAVCVVAVYTVCVVDVYVVCIGCIYSLYVDAVVLLARYVLYYFNSCTVRLLLFCTVTNTCTINSQIITLFLHVSTKLCHPQGARS